MTDQPLVYTVEEAAEILRIGRTAAYEAARRGDLPVVRIGRTLRVPRHRLEALIEARAAADPELKLRAALRAIASPSGKTIEQAEMIARRALEGDAE